RVLIARRRSAWSVRRRTGLPSRRTSIAFWLLKMILGGSFLTGELVALFCASSDARAAWMRSRRIVRSRLGNLERRTASQAWLRSGDEGKLARGSAKRSSVTMAFSPSTVARATIQTAPKVARGELGPTTDT